MNYAASATPRINVNTHKGVVCVDIDPFNPPRHFTTMHDALLWAARDAERCPAGPVVTSTAPHARGSMLSAL